MTAPTLSARQRRVLVFLRLHFAEHGWAPTVREVAAACGYASPSAAQYQLDELARLGFIRRGHGARAIALTNQETL